MPDIHSSGRLSRRNLLGAIASALVLGTSLVGCTPRASRRQSPSSEPTLTFAEDLATVSRAGGSITRSLFSPADAYLAGYAATIVDLANGVIGQPGPTQGFISGDFWRAPGRTYDARVQENVLTLAWFLTNPRSWNPYAGSPELEQRLRVALGYYLSLQHDDGSFPTSGPDDHNRATTTFALSTLASTRDALASYERTSDLLDRINESIARAAKWFLDPKNAFVWTGGVVYSNQVIEGLSGLESSRELVASAQREIIDTGWQRLNNTGLSPAGHLYEREGVDFTYSMRVALPSLARASVTSPSPIPASLLRSHLDFCGYNYLWEADRRGYIVNGAPATRMSSSIFLPFSRELTEVPPPLLDVRGAAPRADAFIGSADDRRATATSWLTAARAVVPPLGSGAVSPHPFLASAPTSSWPSESDFTEAINDLPYLKSNRFIERRADPSKSVDFTFVRRPAFYLGLFTGRHRLPEQRMGGGFLYEPSWGTVLLSQRESDLAWGVNSDGFNECESDIDLNVGDDAEDALLTAGGGRCSRKLSFGDHALSVQLAHEGPFTEQLPLLLRPSDTVLCSIGPVEGPLQIGQSVADVAEVVIQRGGGRLSIAFDSPATVIASSRSDDTFGPSVRCRLSLIIEAENRLSYMIGVTT